VTTKERISATVDPDLVGLGEAAVAAGLAPNLSGWVNQALRRQTEHDRRLLAFDEFLAEYEAEHGVITEAEMDAAQRRSRARARVKRPGAR
jgi:hypothetical protein